MSEAGDDNSTDGNDCSSGPSSISSDLDVRDLYIRHLTDPWAAERIFVQRNPGDSYRPSYICNINTWCCAQCCELELMQSSSPVDEFVMRKMEDRPPRYEEIENDRIASPEIPDGYDEEPIANGCGEPPPQYDAIHYARSCQLLQRTLTTSMRRRNEVVRANYSAVTEVVGSNYSTVTEVVRPNYSTVTAEVTATTTTSEVVIRRANQESITRARVIYSNCELPRRNHPTFTTVYQRPKMTTAVTGIGPTNEEIAQRDDMHDLLSRIQWLQWMDDPTTDDRRRNLMTTESI